LNPFKVDSNTLEFVGAVLFIIGTTLLSMLAGLLPRLRLLRSDLLVLSIDLAAMMVVGAIIMVIALRQQGRSWHGILGILLAIAAALIIVFFVGTALLFQYLPDLRQEEIRTTLPANFSMLTVVLPVSVRLVAPLPLLGHNGH
jgi:Kef-type K+ transport system membrane component KefB